MEHLPDQVDEAVIEPEARSTMRRRGVLWGVLAAVAVVIGALVVTSGGDGASPAPKLAIALGSSVTASTAPDRGLPAEVTYAADFFRWFAGEAVRVDGGYRPSPAGNGRILTLKRPVGPCLLITPWNFPIAMGARKIAPALAAGCPCIVKPATAPLVEAKLEQIQAEIAAEAPRAKRRV